MKNIYKIVILRPASLLLSFTIIIVLFCTSCKEMPSESEGPDNPIDPNNPNNSIRGPALILSPTNIQIKSGNQFQLDLWIVETDSVAGMSTRIIFDPTEFSVQNVDSLSVTSESFFLKNGGQLIWFCTINNDSGFVQIDCAVVEGSPRNVIGTGVISKIVFDHITGSDATIRISEQSYLRDDQNDKVQINTYYDATINSD